MTSNAIAQPLKAQTVDSNLVPYFTNPIAQVPPPNLIPPPQAPINPPVPNLGPGTITVKRFEVVGSTAPYLVSKP
ncbi:MAG: hypothetical protein JOZ78_21080 [Chroococcidiopsidaceae cyanobacterium CP_BM_ER_R8_30]|nr:hypothetical protein [Chroococcidiopsidaceae cyanobacterium CP_BM_ER_R8_30]